jgi:F5/8 type C domain
MLKSPKRFFICCLGLLAAGPLLQANPPPDMSPIQVQAVTASSDGTENSAKWPHHPEMVIDGNPKTCWASSATDTIGAWLKFDFGSKKSVGRIEIVNGWIPEGYPDFFTQNDRAKKITLLYDNGKMETFDLRDNNDIQALSPVLAGETQHITLRVDEIYPAVSTSDKPWVTISEVKFF